VRSGSRQAWEYEGTPLWLKVVIKKTCLEDLDQWLIPFRNLMQNIEMGKARQRMETLRIVSKISQSLTKHLNDPIE